MLALRLYYFIGKKSRRSIVILHLLSNTNTYTHTLHLHAHVLRPLWVCTATRSVFVREGKAITHLMPNDAKLVDSEDEEDGVIDSSGEEKENGKEKEEEENNRSGKPPPESPKRGGWGDVSGNTKRSTASSDEDDSKRSSGGGGDRAPQKKKATKLKKGRRRSRDRGGSNNHRFDEEGSDEDGILHIPTLEEEDEDEETEQLPTVADAPKMLSLRIKSMSELNDMIQHSIRTASEGGADLGMLTKMLAPKSSLEEEDVEWDFGSLLQEVAHEINIDEEAKRKAKTDDDEPNGSGPLF